MKPDSILGKLASFLVSLVAIGSGSCLMLWQMLIVDLDMSPELFAFAWVAVVLVYGILWASIIVHELGHLLVALAVDMRISHVRLGPIEFVREGQRFRMRIKWSSTTPGFVIPLPEHGRDLRRRLFLIIAAGPLTNLLVGSLLFVIFFLANESSGLGPIGTIHPARIPWMPQTLTLGWVVMAGILNLMLGFHNLIPSNAGGLMTDGGQLANLLRGDNSGTRSMYLLALAALSQKGVRPRDWDRSIIEEMLDFRDGSASDVSAALYAYYHALDSGLIDLAGRLLDQAVIDLNLYPAESRPAVLLEAIYFDAFYRGDARTAREALPLAEGGVVEGQTRLRAEAAVLFAEGRYEEAVIKAKVGLELLPRSSDPGGALTEGEWLNSLCVECQKRMIRAESPNPQPSL